MRQARPRGALGPYAPDMLVAQVQAEVQERFERQIMAAFRAAKAGIR